MRLIKYIKFLALFGTIFLIAGACGNKPNSAQGCKEKITEVEVSLKDDAFNPSTLVIKNCTKVVFKNNGAKDHWPASDLHPTHGIFPEFDPLKGIQPNEQWEFVFEKKGSWKYHDHLHPQIRGIIKVED